MKELKNKIGVDVEGLNKSTCVINAERKLEIIYTKCIFEKGGYVVQL